MLRQEQNQENYEMQLFAYLEALQPKWVRLCLRKPKEQYELQLNLGKKRYHYAEGKTLEELLVNLRSRIEKLQQAC